MHGPRGRRRGENRAVCWLSLRANRRAWAAGQESPHHLGNRGARRSRTFPLSRTQGVILSYPSGTGLHETDVDGTGKVQQRQSLKSSHGHSSLDLDLSPETGCRRQLYDLGVTDNWRLPRGSTDRSRLPARALATFR